MSKRILILTDDLKYSCGISSYLYNFLSENKSTEFEFYILCSGGDSVERFREITPNVFIDAIYSEKKKNYLNFLMAVFKLLVFSWRHEINIVHAQNYYVANIARYVSSINRIKTIQTHHNFFKETKKLKLMACEYQIVVNDDINQYLRDHFPDFDKDKIKTIRYGIPEYSLNFPKGNNVLKVINAGRLVPEKGTDLYLDAVKELHEDIFNLANFYLAGEGTETSRLLKRIDDEKIKITYLGVLEPLTEYLKRTDIFIFTSHWDAEGFPMSILEAAMCKNLIISSNFRGLEPHFLKDFHGVTFKENDFIDLTTNIVNVINNYSSKRQFVNNFYSKINKTFSLRISIEKTLSLYMDILSDE